ncbi:MAG: mechanosensitive ion channel domain-containing protein, partial [Candidatus Dormibacteria bacterium]
MSVFRPQTPPRVRADTPPSPSDEATGEPLPERSGTAPAHGPARASARVVRGRLQHVRELGEHAPAALARTSRAARRARRELAVLLPVLVAIPALRWYQPGLFEQTAVKLAAAALLVVVGWNVARDLGRLAGPRVLGRVSGETAGPLDFLVRAVTLGGVILLALHIVGVNLAGSTLATGGTVGVIVVGLAAQQTLANLLAGLVLVVSRPLRIGDVVRLQSGLLAGSVEGTV